MFRSTRGRCSVKNVVWQYFSGQEYYEPKLPCDATQIGRFRKGIGEAGVEEILKATIDTAAATGTIQPEDFQRKRAKRDVLYVT